MGCGAPVCGMALATPHSRAPTSSSFCPKTSVAEAIGAIVSVVELAASVSTALGLREGGERKREREVFIIEEGSPGRVGRILIGKRIV